MENRNLPRYVFVTGGVVSGLGKGITAASAARLFRDRGYTVSVQKFDPYINIDPGTMNPVQHGEVFVTEDGTETDLDLGHYERFTGLCLGKDANTTTGKLYREVLAKERSGEYGGGTVQVIPHITDAIKNRFRNGTCGINFIEIGGTAGDIESRPFFEAIRQFRQELGPERTALVHVVLIPYLESSGELKSKPAQSSVKELQSMGIQPDILVCRTLFPLTPGIKKKLATYCNTDIGRIAENRNLSSLYDVPAMLEKENLPQSLEDVLGLGHRTPDTSKWDAAADALRRPGKTVRIALVGKYTELHDAYISVAEALKHGAALSGAAPDIKWVDAELIEKDGPEKWLSDVSGIIIPGGFGSRGTEGMAQAAGFARDRRIPFLGICLGMQEAVISFCRDVCGIREACSAETNPGSEYAAVDIMPDKKNTESTGGTLRLGAYPCRLKQGTLAKKLYGTADISERHRHRYEISNRFRDTVERAGGVFSGMSPDGKICEMFELPESMHPFYIATQAHPEFRSRPDCPHPLFAGFTAAACRYGCTETPDYSEKEKEAAAFLISRGWSAVPPEKK